MEKIKIMVNLRACLISWQPTRSYGLMDIENKKKIKIIALMELDVHRFIGQMALMSESGFAFIAWRSPLLDMTS
jgi:hypothetical protein